MKKKVLIVTAPLNIGGFDVVASNLQKYLDKNKFETTFYIKGEKVGVLEKTVVENGAKVIHKPDCIKGYLKEYNHLKKIMKDGEYDIVHSHLMFYSGMVMRAAYKVGVKKRVPHSHMTNPCLENRSMVKRIVAKGYSVVMKKWLNKYGTDLVACGPEAGVYLYGAKSFEKRGILLNNAIDLERFKFDKEARNAIRRELSIEDKLIIGHVGRLNYVKNHKFLIDVFYEIQKLNKDTVLLIVGDGEERETIEQKAKKLGIENKVIFTGTRTDTERLISAMDIMVFPSLHEGLPVVLIEAQATKLPCLIADTVSRYSKQNDNIEFMSLKETPEEWAKKAVELAECDREKVSTAEIEKNYDIKKIAKQLEKIYED